MTKHLIEKLAITNIISDIYMFYHKHYIKFHIS